MKLILVDLDGTLFDTKEVNYLAYKEAIEPYGYSIDYKYYCDFCNGRHYLDFLPQISTSNMSILEKIHKSKKKNYSKYLSYARINNGLEMLLRSSKDKYKIALVTTASKENTNDILHKFAIEDLFDLILTHDDIAKSKPDPEGFLKAMKAFDSKPEECIIFEDSEVGIEAADKTGATVFIVRGYN